MNKKNRGIALILVLMLSAILAVLGIAFQTYSRNIVERLKKQDIKSELIIKRESELQKLLFSLMTTNQLFSTPSFSRSYKLSGDIEVYLSVSGHNSKISVLNIDENFLREILEDLLKSTSDVDVAVDSLLDWIDSDNSARINGWESADYQRAERAGAKNGPISSISELAMVRGFDTIPIDVLKRLFTVYPVYGIDRISAPQEILSQFYSNENVVKIIEARQAGEYDDQVFKQITGDNNNYRNGTGLFYVSISLVLSKQGVVEQQQIDAKISPLQPIPLEVYQAGFK